jgi:hypothetical protein
MLMNNSKLAVRSGAQAVSGADRGSPGSKGSTISLDRVEDPEEPDRATPSAIYSKNSRKCLEEAARGGRRDDHSSRQKAKTLL